MIIDEQNLVNFQKQINVKFNDLELLQKSLTHRSFVNETKDVINNNERLEFLGDAVLELITTRHLFEVIQDR